ncbi:hypothetical protein KDH_78170 [Dictyobacter sp. S3.2.2.5]|uniref:HTH araC/xylS-type domain-containing protein n=1 Tax=Dictyobacter halimunensis TaxID=3026934 RepID=A0ABQ6G398_9CHLR|nr:hypothetical protein KDH_78170 [Dictyobacter sp. S3.2.2.5]
MQQREQDTSYWSNEVVVGEVVYPPGSTLGPRIQPTLQFVFVHAGRITIRIDERTHIIPANSAFVLYPGHREYFAFAEDCETIHSWIHIAPALVEAGMINRLRKQPWPLPLSPAMQQLMQDALALHISAFPTVKEMLSALALQICWRYIGEGEQLSLGHETVLAHSAVGQAQQFIYEHLSEQLTLAIIAEAVAISPAHLIRLFQQHLHTTPMAYVWEQRISMGIKLLEQTGLSVGRIAEQCGFQSRYHFSRRIRQAIGYTPLEVRHRSWQLDPSAQAE